MKKSIVIIGSAYPLRGGGISTFNELLATKLQEAGHQVKIITFSLQYPSFLFPGKSQYATEPRAEHLTIEVSLNSINPISWYNVGKQVQLEAPDLVIFRYWTPFIAPCLGTVGRLIHQNYKTKIVTIADNIIPHEKNIVDKPLTSYFLKCSDGFVTMSRSVLEDLKKFNIRKAAVHTIPTPCTRTSEMRCPKQDARTKLKLDASGKYLLFFGFIRKYKGLDILLQAFADKRIQDAGIKLIIAGEYYDKPDEYEAIIREYALQDAVIQVNDFIPDSEVSAYFCAADMVVQTYKTATQSGVTQIAYYYNKPMLVTNVGGLAELVPDQKVGYVTTTSVTEIADAILDFYQNKREAAFVDNIKLERERFTWG